jgi:hypothetical protein
LASGSARSASPPASSTRFLVANARVVRINRREKVTYLTILTSSERGSGVDYWDVVCFPDSVLGVPPMDGDSVTVRGSLSRRKPQEGSKGWTTELVARSVEPGDEALTPVQAARAAPVVVPLDETDVPF